MNTSKINNLGWSPLIHLKEGILKTVSEYLKVVE
jgi:dTDP-D-glucose 4,6-dehydratase